MLSTQRTQQDINTSDSISDLPSCASQGDLVVHVNLGIKGVVKVAGCDIHNLSAGTQVVVYTPKGSYVGTVDQVVHDDTNDSTETSQYYSTHKVERVATEIDIDTARSNAEYAKQSITICQQISDNIKLGISIVDAKYSLDKRRLSFYFVAKSRVDFREFAKDLARQFGAYIDLRQIEQPKNKSQLSSCGPCGRQCCCSIGLKRHSTIKMVKNQNLPLNPNNITGLCGNLRCCLTFENEQYSDVKRRCPKVGAGCCNSQGRCGRVSQINYLKETVVVRHAEDDNVDLVEYPIQDITSQEGIPKEQ